MEVAMLVVAGRDDDAVEDQQQQQQQQTVNDRKMLFLLRAATGLFVLVAAVAALGVLAGFLAGGATGPAGLGGDNDNSSVARAFENRCLLDPNQTFDGRVVRRADGAWEAFLPTLPCPANHASSLEQVPATGEILLSWFSGSIEGAADVAIVLARLPPSGDQWSQPEVLARRPGFSNQNPLLFFDDLRNETHLLFTQQVAAVPPDQNTARVWALKSLDFGRTWSRPALRLSKAGSFHRNRILRAADGRTLIFPTYMSFGHDLDQFSTLHTSADFGQTWTRLAVFPNSKGLVQPSVIRTFEQLEGAAEKTGVLKAFFRDRRAENVYSAVSQNDGRTWSRPKKTPLVNNNVAVQAISLASGAVAMVRNDCNVGRTPLVVSLSLDGGETWPLKRALETTGPSDELPKPEFSYPSLMQSADGSVHISYTFNRRTIKYVRILDLEEWIVSG